MNKIRIPISDALVVEVERIPSGEFFVEKLGIVPGDRSVRLSEHPIELPEHKSPEEVVDYILSMATAPDPAWENQVRERLRELATC